MDERGSVKWVGSAESSESSHPAPAAEKRLPGPERVKLHLTLTVGIALCIAGFIFEVSRALGGNSLSWAYVFEWPLFAVFAVYMWWNLLHGNSRGQRPSRRPEVAPEHVEMLKAWNEHLRQMAADQEAGAANPDSGTNANR
jgi:hypothetical protein